MTGVQTCALPICFPVTICEYTNAGGTPPSVPSGLSGYYGGYGGSFQDTSTSTFSATGRQWQIEVDAYTTITGTIYVS